MAWRGGNDLRAKKRPMPEMILQLLITGILLGGVYALVSIGLTLIFGVLDVVNFAHGEFLMIGMYIVFWLFTLLHIDPYLSPLLVAPLLFLIGLFVGRTVIRPTIGAPSSVQIFATVGVSLILMNGALVLWKADFRSVSTSYGSGTIALGPIFIGEPQLISFVWRHPLFSLALSFPQIYLYRKGDSGHGPGPPGCHAHGDRYPEDLCLHLWNRDRPGWDCVGPPCPDLFHLPRGRELSLSWSPM